MEASEDPKGSHRGWWCFSCWEGVERPLPQPAACKQKWTSIEQQPIIIFITVSSLRQMSESKIARPIYITLLCIASNQLKWSKMIVLYIIEMLDRSALWSCRHHPPQLMSSSDSELACSDSDWLHRTFESNSVAHRDIVTPLMAKTSMYPHMSIQMIALPPPTKPTFKRL